MSFARQLGEEGDGEMNFGSEQINNNTTVVDDDQPLGENLRAYREAEIEVLIMRILQRSIIPAVESMTRRIVKEEYELAAERLLASMNRNPEDEIRTSEPRSLKLQFVDKISAVILTGDKIVGKDFAPLKIALVDALTDKVVNFGPEASAKVKLVVLGADSDGINGDDWTPEEFDSKTVRKIEGRNSVLVGNEHLNLKEGVGVVSEVSFTHTAIHLKSCRYRLGAKVVDHFNGIRIKEAKTEPFILKDCRCKYHEKRDSLTLDDEVWQLKGIGKNGPFHKRLMMAKIKTMKDFLDHLFADPQGLKQILNGRDKMWTKTVQLARRCANDNKAYVYPSPSSEQKTQIDAEKSVVSAFQHRKDVIDFDDESELIRASSRLFNDPSNSTRLEAPGGNHVLTSNMVDHDVPSTFYPSTSFHMDYHVEAPGGNYVLTSNMVDHDVPSNSYPSTSFHMDYHVEAPGGNHVLTSSMVDDDVPSTSYPYTSFHMDVHVEAPGGNHVLTSNMVDHDVPSTSFTSISFNPDDFLSCVESHEKRPRKYWKFVSGVIMLLPRKRIVAVEETHVPKKMKCF